MKHGHVGAKHKSGKQKGRHHALGHAKPMGSTDPAASAEHKSMNSEHGMAMGNSPPAGYDDGGESSSEGMGEQNCEEC